MLRGFRSAPDQMKGWSSARRPPCANGDKQREQGQECDLSQCHDRHERNRETGQH